MLQLGDPAPDITLHTPYQVEVTLRPLLYEGSTLVEFIRGTWDPNARRRLEELSRLKGRLQELRTRCFVISCERPETARAYLESSSSTVSLLIDKKREVSRAYRVFQRFSYGAFNVARPATFILDRCGFIRYAAVGTSPIRTAPVSQLLAALEDLQKEGS